MNDDNACSKRDMDKLEIECRLVNSKCYLCLNCIPQAGYDAPHCKALSTERHVLRLSGNSVKSGIQCASFVDKREELRKAELIKARMELLGAKRRLYILEKDKRQ